MPLVHPRYVRPKYASEDGDLDIPETRGLTQALLGGYLDDADLLG